MKEDSPTSTTKKIPSTTKNNNFFPLNLTINFEANFTMEMKEAGQVVNTMNSTDYSVYLGNASQINKNSILPLTFNFNSELTASSISKMEPRHFYLYPEVNSEIYVYHLATISSKITTPNIRNSTVFFSPKIEFFIGKMNITELFGQGFSARLENFKTVSELVIVSNSTFKFTVFSKDCIFYETDIHFSIGKNKTSSFEGKGNFPIYC